MSRKNPNPEWFQTIKTYVKSEAIAALVGKFHAHLSIKLTSDEIPRLQQVCKQRKIKLTIIDLENNSGQSQTDVMTTTYYKDPKPGAVQRIANQLADLSTDLQQQRLNVIRAKLEHESLPSLPIFNEHHYHEVHVKLEIAPADYQQTHDQLCKIGASKDFVPSRNPLAQREDCVIQFINLRIYEGTHDDADQTVDGVLASIQGLPVKVMDVKRETVVFDTHQKLDNWWL